MLEIRNLHVSYGQGDVLRGVSLGIPDGGFTALIGANGAGKSTLMRTVSGLMKPSKGSIVLDGQEISGQRAERVVRQGVALVPEGRKVFAPLSVGENLEMGAFQFLMRGTKDRYRRRLDFVLALFPRLAERLAQPAGTLSGGEQQMLAIGRALMCEPRLLLLDEPSMGLAPLVVTQIFATLSTLCEQGLTIFVCEQNSEVTLRHAAYGHVLENGQVTLSGPAGELLRDERVKEAYLGV
ncbi:LIV-I protein F [Variovorax sp. PBS-H4]|uniref:ABC transporter ATP-binding protein n=1 Tax=Variovorax sp. PBS-H4 TaxID=434008 RepID=UPI00131737E1|nr:ABC transporter ATP-binding protein [Variovorax sp. PBS-H4]VTU27614.1 LIV-I protein F [Variovorax sp. PBS-H4]